MGKSERSVAFCKLPDPGLLAAAEWEPLRAVSHRLSEPAIMATGPDFATSVCPADLVFLFGNCSAEKYREVHNFGETACNLKWAVSPSPQCSAAAGWRRGPRPVEPCCLPKSGSAEERSFVSRGARDFVSRARAHRRRSHRSCQPEAGEAVGGSRPTYSGGSRPSSSSFAFQAIGSWVAVLLLVNQLLIAELLWLGSSAGLKSVVVVGLDAHKPE